MKNNKLYIDEEEVLSAIQKVLKENRKVIKLNNGGNSTPAPMPQQDMSMSAPAPMDNTMPPADPNAAAAPADPMGGEMPPMDNADENGADSQFDTNFDAGVEADEDTDPKHYIQQLTGKLSQSLNSFNNEQGGDAGLNKYVASMIITAACKSLDEKAKKELIEKIKSASSEDEEDMPTDDEDMSSDEGMENGDMSEMPDDPNMQQPPMNEAVYTKKSLMLNESVITKKYFRNGHLTETGLRHLTNEMGFNDDVLGTEEDRPQETNPKVTKNTPKAWKSKF